MHHFFNEKKPRRDLVEFPRRGRTFSPWLKKVESTTRHFLRVETEKKRRRIEEAKNQAKNSARMQINPESGKFTPLFVYHRRINYPSFSPCRLRHPIFSISRFACYSSSFRIKSYQWSMWLWFYSSLHPFSLIFPAKSFRRSNFWRKLEKSPPSNLFLNAAIEFTEELPARVDPPDENTGSLWAERAAQTLVPSSKLPMAIDEREKNYSRSRIYRATLFSPVITLLLGAW